MPVGSHYLTTATSGNGSGSVSPSYSNTQENSGTIIPLTAIPNPGSVFTGWSSTPSGYASGSANPLSFSMPSATVTVTANFTLLDSITLPASNSVRDGFSITVINTTAGNLTINPTGTDTIEGASTYVISPVVSEPWPTITLVNRGSSGIWYLMSPSGTQGITGAGIQGVTGIQGGTGIQGVTGTYGILNPVGQVEETINALGSVSGDQNIDFSLGNVLTATVIGSGTWSFINAVAGKECTICLILTNANSYITFSPLPKWPNGASPTFSSSGTDIVMFTTPDGGETIYGLVSGLGFA